MNKASEVLVERIRNAASLDAAKAYADAVQVIESQGSLVSVELEPGIHGTNYPFINVIKEIRSVFNLGLKESKELVEAGHKWTDLRRGEAESLVRRLGAVGAKARIV